MASNITNALQGFFNAPIVASTVSSLSEAASYISPSKALANALTNERFKSIAGPIGDIAFPLIGKAASYISPKGAWNKAIEFIPFRAMAVGSIASQTALFGISATFGLAAYKTTKMRSKALYAGTAILAASLGVYEILTFRRAMSCLSSFECPQSKPSTLAGKVNAWRNPSVSCTEQTQAAFLNCYSLI
ncbi:MAG: hypothetical protein K1060chlam4_00618 [Candidatus Anoxychlamydiales bacterium]|nr:hypothetical protein [Candidatus Anoxychlamydiales bacterium]